MPKSAEISTLAGMDIDLEAAAVLSEVTETNPEAGLSSGPNLAHGTLRKVICASLSLSEDRFNACFISLPDERRTLRPDDITAIAAEWDLEPE